MATTEITVRPPRGEEEGGTVAFWCSLMNCVVTTDDCASCDLARTLCAEIGPWGGETVEEVEEIKRGETVKGMEKAVEKILIGEISEGEIRVKEISVEEIREQMKEGYRNECERSPAERNFKISKKD